MENWNEAFGLIWFHVSDEILDMWLVSESIKLQWMLLAQGHSLPLGKTHSLSNYERNTNKKWMKLFAKTNISH